MTSVYQKLWSFLSVLAVTGVLVGGLANDTLLISVARWLKKRGLLAFFMWCKHGGWLGGGFV